MALVGFQYEPVSLDVNKICLEEEQDITDTRETPGKSQSVTEWSRYKKWGAMLATVELPRSWRFGILSITGYEIRW